ncbi:phage tail family protein [Kocuria rosea]|uniref:phage tail family protein n=1 Tax=Kocuria rosea TaxID=1275 RepID=UPI0011A01F04|nr:phage tail family protein [Kocuria rosea]
MSSLPVRLLSLDMNRTPDFNGDRFIVTDFEGLDSPTVEYKGTDNYGDGEMLSRLRLGPREMNIKGIAWSPREDAHGIWRVRQKLTSAFASLVLNPAWVYVDTISPGVKVQMQVRAGGELHLPTPKSHNVQEFEIPIRAADPRKYVQLERTQTISGAATVVSQGDYPTNVLAVLQQPTNLAALTNNSHAGKRMRFAFNGVPAGAYIDFAKKRVGDSAGPREIGKRSHGWWSLQPGANSITAVGVWKLTWRDAFY